GTRRELKLPKSHINDAFVIAGGIAQKRTTPLRLEQRRRNDRRLEKFYDAKYLDLRTKEPATGKELSSGRKIRNREQNKQGPSLRVFRGHKLKKGHRQIRKKRYTIQSGDIVLYDHHKWVCAGTQKKGRYLNLKRGDERQRVKPDQAKLWKYRKGICRKASSPPIEPPKEE
ncbi:MAG: paclitaxel/taxanoid biosynthesis susceptibility protein TS1, partial [Candidatus Hermodarchaeota archaeon]